MRDVCQEMQGGQIQVRLVLDPHRYGIQLYVHLRDTGLSDETKSPSRSKYRISTKSAY